MKEVEKKILAEKASFIEDLESWRLVKISCACMCVGRERERERERKRIDEYLRYCWANTKKGNFSSWPSHQMWVAWLSPHHICLPPRGRLLNLKNQLKLEWHESFETRLCPRLKSLWDKEILPGPWVHDMRW